MERRLYIALTPITYMFAKGPLCTLTVRVRIIGVTDPASTVCLLELFMKRQ